MTVRLRRHNLFNTSVLAPATTKAALLFLPNLPNPSFPDRPPEKAPLLKSPISTKSPESQLSGSTARKRATAQISYFYQISRIPSFPDRLPEKEPLRKSPISPKHFSHPEPPTRQLLVIPD
jgi:hypothetical protein